MIQNQHYRGSSLIRYRGTSLLMGEVPLYLHASPQTRQQVIKNQRYRGASLLVSEGYYRGTSLLMSEVPLYLACQHCGYLGSKGI